MFERFTDRARRVCVLAQEEARGLNHNYIGTEHLLLGLIHEGEGVAVKALESLGISLELARQKVEEVIGQGQHKPSGPIPFTPRAKKVLELALREALQLGHNYIGTEHILLALIREGDGVGAQVLMKLGADLNVARQQVIRLLHPYQGQELDNELDGLSDEELNSRVEAYGREVKLRALRKAAETAKTADDIAALDVVKLVTDVEELRARVKDLESHSANTIHATFAIDGKEVFEALAPISYRKAKPDDDD